MSKKPAHRSISLAPVFFVGTGVFCVLILSLALYSVYASHHYVPIVNAPQDVQIVRGFPIGVQPNQKQITEDPEFEYNLNQYLTGEVRDLRRERFFTRLLSRLSEFTLYQQFATPRARTLVVYPGQRKEEIAENIQVILSWSEVETASFLQLVEQAEPLLREGKFYPGRYIVDIDATPEQVAAHVLGAFRSSVLDRYTSDVSDRVSLKDALIIASLLEREAYDFTDMRIIAGIIWNRLFTNMPLQLDASLQYARANSASASWWPKVIPEDKFVDSPFNTYQSTGLPPSPIANPSVAAIIAALNPKDTECLFYFHTDDGSFYCTPTYEEHVALLTKHFGQGR